MFVPNLANMTGNHFEQLLNQFALYHSKSQYENFMSIFNNRFLLLFLLVPVVFYLGLIGYKTYQEYRRSLHNQSAIETMTLVKKLNTLEQAIDTEVLQSALKTQGDKSTANVLLRARKRTDILINHSSKILSLSYRLLVPRYSIQSK